MTVSDTARRNHDDMFGDHVSTMAQTDPKLIEVFDHFVFDEVTADSQLDSRKRVMVQVAAIIAAQAHAEYRVVAGAAFDTQRITPVELKETVYQAVTFVGLAKVFEVLHATSELLTDRNVTFPSPGRSTTLRETRLGAGLAVQNCLGDPVGRVGMNLAHRELLTFAMLVALGGAGDQVKGHVAGNLNVGNDRATLLNVLGVLTVLLPFLGYPRTLNGLAAVDEMAPAA